MAVNINGREYEWGDLTLVLAGRDLTRFRGIKYSEKVEREPVWAKGRQPVAIQSGNESYEGEIKMLQSEYEALIKAGKGTIKSLSVDALVSYGDPFKGDNMITDRIESLRFTEGAKEFNQGDKFAEVTLPFIALRIVNQV
ncbi:hypothetical protein [Chryseobacterium koreense]|uniref:Phage tail protein n=1 Tax=Chryseobacterium koreense CCUG 49689 TaxID=1304281 RepID=A0A0J7IWR2_9FLAO|nr:hypothetical protein [Chryseobacterium koreense]KMQ70239.1 hypothetical protein ACM44_13375 [Chryseobacterium koreense CCUG 49689]MBB5334739.1 hypothetical protein [Chryseobacterium koreense]